MKPKNPQVPSTVTHERPEDSRVVKIIKKHQVIQLTGWGKPTIKKGLKIKIQCARPRSGIQTGFTEVKGSELVKLEK